MIGVSTAHDTQAAGANRRLPVIVMDFSGVYGLERFAHQPSIVRLDCTHLNGTDCYCDAQGAAAIRGIIAPFSPDGIHFIDNGNHHYVTRFWTEKIREPFNLIVFDHHSDAQPPTWGPSVLSCGGWIANEVSENRLLRRVLVIGPSERSIAAVPNNLKHRIRFFNETILDAHPDWVTFAEEHIRGPVYISIDKDILSRQSVQTNWDQGHVPLATLQSHLRDILEHECVIGVDVCGECPVLLDIAEEQVEAATNDTVNERLLRLLSDDSVS